MQWCVSVCLRCFCNMYIDCTDAGRQAQAATYLFIIVACIQNGGCAQEHLKWKCNTYHICIASTSTSTLTYRCCVYPPIILYFIFGLHFDINAICHPCLSLLLLVSNPIRLLFFSILHFMYDVRTYVRTCMSCVYGHSYRLLWLFIPLLFILSIVIFDYGHFFR